MPSTAPDLVNGRKARRRGKVLGSNLDFLPVGPPLSWWASPKQEGLWSSFQKRALLSHTILKKQQWMWILHSHHLFWPKVWISDIPPGFIAVYAKLSGTELLDAVQKNWVKGLLALVKKKIQEPFIIHLSLSPTLERLRISSSTKSAITLCVYSSSQHIYIKREWLCSIRVKLFY